MSAVSDFLYDKKFTIDHTTVPEDKTGYQKKITLDNSNFDFTQAKSDGADIRFTSSDKTTLIPYWIDSWDSTNQKATIFVKVDISTTTDTIFYMYFGNTNATDASDGDSIFEFFDDFNGTSLDTNKWDIVGSPILSFSNSVLTITMTESGWNSIVAKHTNLANYRLIFKASLTQGNKYFNFIGWDEGSGDPNSGFSGAASIVTYFGTSGGDKLWTAKDTNTATSVDIVNPDENIHKYTLEWASSEAKLYIDDSYNVNNTSNIPSVAMKPSAGLASTDATIQIDYIYILEISSEPSYTVGATEQNPSVHKFIEFNSTKKILQQSIYKATTNPSANSIPIADANGKLNAWVDADMEKSVYDTNNDGIVDNTDTIRGKVPNISANTIPDLLAVDTAKFQSVNLLGYHTQGDGGGGVFYWDANESKSNHDGGTVIDPTKTFPTDWSDSAQQDSWLNTTNTGSGCWKRVYNNSIKIQWWGVKTDITYSSSNNIIFTKVKDICINNNLALLSKDITYYLDGDIDITGLTLIGSGQNNSYIILSGSNTNNCLFRNHFATFADDTGWGQGGGDIYIRDITLKGNWDGSSDQTTITPPSGVGNGLVGMRYADYGTDNKAVLQLISSTRNILKNVTIMRGYEHNIILTRGAYGVIENCEIKECRGSGIYSPNPSSTDTITSNPISSCRFETCRGEYGGIYAENWNGDSIKNNLFEEQPYGIYLDSSPVILSIIGNYAENHYYEDYHIPGTVWGLQMIGNYSYNQETPSGDYKALFFSDGYNGVFVSNDNISYGIGNRQVSLNNHFLQFDYMSYGGKQTISDYNKETGYYFNKQIATTAGGSEYGYSVIRHQHNLNSLSGAAEIRFKRNLHADSIGGLGFAVSNGTTLTEVMTIVKDGVVILNNLPTSDPAVAGQLWNDSGTLKVSAG